MFINKDESGHDKLSLVVRKPVFGVFDQVRHKPGCTATEDGWRLEISDFDDHFSLKKLMQQGICNPEFYGNLVYKFNKIIGNPNVSNLLKRIVNRFKRAGYYLDIMCDRCVFKRFRN